MTPIRALGLLSGGLDSSLAARLLLDQGVEVVGLHLESPTACRNDVHAVARELGIRVEVRAKGEAYLRLLQTPRFGYGSHMNPCVDCRVFMLQTASRHLDEFGARFLFTGEVIGQRPMSQMRDRIALVDRQSGLEGRVLRPLSARLLPETEPERLGWVDRTRLLGISGRGRDMQLALARRYGLTAHTSPGGGCLLTDPEYSRRLRDLLEHDREPAMDDVALLRIGRHFRVTPGLKVVLGRDAAENAKLRGWEGPSRRLVEPEGFPGPTALVVGEPAAVGTEAARDLIGRFARPGPGERRVRWREGEVLIYSRLTDAVGPGEATSLGS